ncbi:MAG: OstA-like protein [Bacteroidales bacterium]
MFIRLRLFLLLFVYALYVFVLPAQENKQIEILNTNVLEYNKKSGIEARKLIGNVQFRHEQAVMYCDSAYFYTDENRVEAFGNVSIHQGDTLHLYGKNFQYDGDSKKVRMRDNVRLVDKQTTLTSDYLDYDITQSVGYYTNGGNIINGNNQLKSEEGYYYTNSKIFFFKGNVEIRNPQYTMYSDTLKYNTLNRTAYFLGPTRIISKNNLIYCENGWYNTRNNTSKFYRNAYLTGEGRYLTGDSLYYDRNKGMGKAYNKVILIDSMRKVILSGNYAYYLERPEYALLTDSAVLTLYNDKDSLFLHADSLILRTLEDSANNKLIRAFYRVKFFKPDLQGMADSAVFSTADSTLHLFHTPVLWTGNNQITAEKIELHFANQQLKTIDFINDGFIVAYEGDDRYSQVKGRNIQGFFKNNDLYRLYVIGNGQTIYYAKEKERIIGVNRALCSQINVMVQNRSISRIVFLTQPDAIFYPLSKLPEEEKKLKGFVWYEDKRPYSRADIFR